MKARIHVTLKPAVLDPQGKAIKHSLHDLGFDSVANVRQGKFIELELDETDEATARASLDDMCHHQGSCPMVSNSGVTVFESTVDPLLPSQAHRTPLFLVPLHLCNLL